MYDPEKHIISGTISINIREPGKSGGPRLYQTIELTGAILEIDSSVINSKLKTYNLKFKDHTQTIDINLDIHTI